MNAIDKYDVFLKLSQRHYLSTSTQKQNSSRQSSEHPTILNGKRNINSYSYKKMRQSSEIFKENATPMKRTDISRVNEATTRKQMESCNSKRTLIPDSEMFKSPGRNTSNVRYNVNSESMQKDSKRVLKSVKQREQDFNHRINLPISSMQVQDFAEDKQSNAKKQYDTSSVLKKLFDHQSKIASLPGAREFHNSSKTDRYQPTDQLMKKNLLSTYQLAKSESKPGKKHFIQSTAIYQPSEPDKEKPIKPIHKFYQSSTEESKSNLYKSYKGQVQSFHLDQFKSQLKLL